MVFNSQTLYVSLWKNNLKEKYFCLNLVLNYVLLNNSCSVCRWSLFFCSSIIQLLNSDKNYWWRFMWSFSVDKQDKTFLHTRQGFSLLPPVLGFSDLYEGCKRTSCMTSWRRRSEPNRTFLDRKWAYFTRKIDTITHVTIVEGSVYKEKNPYGCSVRIENSATRDSCSASRC